MTSAGRRTFSSFAAPATRFIGRREDLAQLETILGIDQLVTIWGPAGMGKTRLAQEFAASHRGGAVICCEVEAARDLPSFCAVVARALGVAVEAGRGDEEVVARLGHAIAAEGPVLVVIDNLEQVVEAAAPAIAGWVREAKEARFLVTSRERARIAGEVSFELGPLPLPEGGAATSEAVELFLDRARAVAPARSFGAESWPAIADLVRRLEGIPLAIELAAARVELLGLAGLGERLGERLDLLGGTARGAAPRQATLRGAVAWSWDLLDEPDRRALAAFSLFRGGFDLAAADAILDEPALHRVQSLRDKSLLRAAAPNAARPARLSLYEAVREYAEEKLHERGEADDVAELHAAHFLAIGEAAAEAYARSGAVEALDRLGDEVENLLAVVERALKRSAARATPAQLAKILKPRVTSALRALLAVDPLLSTRGPFGIHLDLLDRALDLAEWAGEIDPLLRARALAARGRARQLRGDEAAGLADLAAAEGCAAALGATAVEASILVDLGVLHHRRREMDRARACYEAALALHRREPSPDRRAEARVLGNLGALHHDERRFDEALRHYEPALALAAAAGDLRTLGIFSTNVGLLEQERGTSAAARGRYERAAAILAEVGDLRLLGITIGNLGSMCHEDGRPEEARAHHERAVALLREAGDRRSEALAEARLGAALASLDRSSNLGAARAALDRADRLLVHEADPLAAELASAARGFLDLALSRAARLAGREEEAVAHLAEARRRIAHAREGAPSAADRSDDVRLCLRILERGIAAVDRVASAAPELLVAPEARWVRPPGGDWQDLRERQAVRRILLRLVEQQRSHPGRGLSLADLQEAGWPGERILPRAAKNRIYVAMNQLRKLGLKEALRKSGEGYYLDPALPVHHTAVEPV
jgi:predicted ATPase